MSTETMSVARSKPFHHGRDTVISYPVVTQGVRTRVVESGSGPNIMVCLHGAGSRSDRWIPAMPGLVAAGYHVFALDFPGHGFADKGDTLEYSGAAFSVLVAGVLDELSLSGVTLAGTSLGGYVGARLASDRPELVKDLILVGAVGVESYPEEFKTDPDVVADGSLEAVRRKLGFLVSDEGMVADAWVREESMINSSEGAREGLHAIATFINVDLDGDLQAARLRERTFDSPVLLIWGAEDRWTPPSMGQDAQRALPGSTLVLMDDCGHAPYFEDPDTFVRVVCDHLGG